MTVSARREEQEVKLQRTSLKPVDSNLPLAQPTPDPPRPLLHENDLGWRQRVVCDDELKGSLSLIGTENGPTGEQWQRFV